MTITEMAPYVYGDIFTRESPAPARCTPAMYKKVVEAASTSGTYSRTIELIDDYKDFLYLEPDIANIFPASEREEMFYCLKNGGYCNDVPAKCIYVLKTLFAKYGSVSLALKALNVNTFKVFFQKNYLNDCTMRDVIKNFVDPDYEPLTETNMRIRHKDYDEVLVLEQDMVALLPKVISGRLADTDLPKITMEQDGLAVDGLLLRFMGGYYGAVNSKYDYRGLV